jgi:DHA1 family inner membrane transport protein
MNELLNKHIKLFGGSPIAVLSIAAAVFIGWQGVMAVPIQIGSVVDGLGISEQRSGFLGTAEITTVSLVTLLLASKIGMWSKPRVALCGVAFVVAGQLLSAFAPGFAFLFACRLIVGVGAGLIYGAACSCIAGNDSGDRLFAWGLALAQLLLASMLYGLPFSSAFDFHKGVFLTLSLLALVFAPFLIKLPDGRQTVTDVRVTEQENVVSLSMIFWFFLALTLFNIAIGMLWGFVERRTVELNMDASQVGLILAALPVGGALGGVLAGLIGHKFGRLKPFVMALVACTVACFTFGLATVGGALLAAILALGIFELFVVAFFIGTASSMDNVGRLASLAGGATLLTYGFGPAVGGVLSGHFSASEICQISGGLCFLAALISMPVGMLLDRRSDAAVANATA